MSIRAYKVGKLIVKIANDRIGLGACAATDLLCTVKKLLDEKEEVNMLFAAAPSQNEFLSELTKKEGIDWERINAFHMDEYQGLERDHPMRFANFLRDKIFNKVPFKQVFYLNESEGSVEGEIKRYAALLESYPTDIVCMGIGENTHIAFNDPHVADFNDSSLVKQVELDHVSRQQQVNDGCFAHFKQVPQTALTLTIPALMNANYIYCMVPGSNKAGAVYHTLNEEVKEKFPSTILRRHPNAILYLDERSANGLKRELS